MRTSNRTRKQTSLIGVGIYSVGEAARLTGANSSAIKRWLLGYKFKYQTSVHVTESVLRHDLPEVDGKLSLSFLDLIEIRFIQEFRSRGVSWPTIKTAALAAHKLFHHNHPFATTKFRTDGETIFADMRESSTRAHLLDLKREQFAIRKVIESSLYDSLEFHSDDQDLLVRWWPRGRKSSVMIDPSISFGEPVESRRSIPTRVLAASMAALKSEDLVSKWYEVPRESVRDAVNFETTSA